MHVSPYCVTLAAGESVVFLAAVIGKACVLGQRGEQCTCAT